MGKTGWDKQTKVFFKENPSRGEEGVFEALGFKSLYTFLIVSRRMVHLLSPGEA